MPEIQMESPVDARTTFNGREFDYFSGTGYLGLQSHPAVLQAAQNALLKYGLSTATSRGGWGEHPIYQELEKEANLYFDAEKTLYFPSGYMGMAILTQASGHLFEHIFIDSSAHFSLWDAAYATNKPITTFNHCQVEHLGQCLQRELLPHERPLIVSDGVFPISGEIAPLPALLELAKIYQGLVFLDDAHSVGVLGVHGRGTPDYFNLQDENCHTCATLSKALGSYGGVIWGSSKWTESIEKNSRVMVGASPPPLIMAAPGACALREGRLNPGLRQQLGMNVKRARDGLRSLGWPLEDTPVPILCLGGRNGVSLEKIQAGLYSEGIAVSLVRAYTSTPPGGALRIAIFATHTDTQIDRLVQTVSRYV